MPTFTREQLEALIDYIDAKIDDKRLDSDLQESIRLSRCRERLEGLVLDPVNENRESVGSIGEVKPPQPESDYRKAIRTGVRPEIWPPIVMSCDELEHFRKNFTTGEQQ